MHSCDTMKIMWTVKIALFINVSCHIAGRYFRILKHTINMDTFFTMSCEIRKIFQHFFKNNKKVFCQVFCTHIGI